MMHVQAAYLSKLKMAKGSAKQVLKVTDHLLQARPALLPDYIVVAKSTGSSFHASVLDWLNAMLQHGCSKLLQGTKSLLH